MVAGFLVMPFLAAIAGMVIVLVFGGILSLVKQMIRDILS